MAATTGPYLDRTGLAFYYDTRNTNESFKGKPTTNVVSGNYDVTFESTAIGNTSGFNNQLGTGNYLGVSNNYGYRSNKSLRVNRGTGGTGRVYRTYSVTAGEYSTVSAWVYSESSGPYLTIEYFGGDYSWGVSQARNYHGGTGWERLFVRTTVAATSNTTGYYFLYPSVQNTDTYWDNIQVEKQAYATPFINGTRSDTQGLVDIMGNSSINTSGVSFDSSGEIVFDGTDDALVLGTDVTSTNGEYTLEALLRPNGSSWGNNAIPLYNTYKNSSTVGFWHHFGHDNVLRWRHGGSSYTVGDLSGIGLVADTWQVTTITWDNTTLKLYKNGVLQNSTTAPSGFTRSTGEPRIGKLATRTSGTPYTWNGDIAAHRVYTRALSADEVAVNASMFKSLTG